MDAQKAKQKYASNTSRATEAYKSGIDGVKVNPMEKAAAASGKYEAGVLAAISEGRYAKGCRDVSLSEWQTAAREKGSKNYATGVKMGEAKYAAYIDENASKIEAIQSQIDRMPSDTPEQREDRAIANMRAMRALKRK